MPLATVGQIQGVTLTPENEDRYVYVGRPSKWGNPYRADIDGTKDEVVAQYKRHLHSRPDLMAALPTLFGKELLCWCRPDELCHARILAEEVNKLYLQTHSEENHV